jgi:hypothetical protein
MAKKRDTRKDVVSAIGKSLDAIEIFTSTVDKLRQANEELESARSADLQRVAVIEQNIKDANEQQARNNSLIVRINSLTNSDEKEAL